MLASHCSHKRGRSSCAWRGKRRARRSVWTLVFSFFKPKRWQENKKWERRMVCVCVWCSPSGACCCFRAQRKPPGACGTWFTSSRALFSLRGHPPHEFTLPMRILPGCVLSVGVFCYCCPSVCPSLSVSVGFFVIVGSLIILQLVQQQSLCDTLDCHLKGAFDAYHDAWIRKQVLPPSSPPPPPRAVLFALVCGLVSCALSLVCAPPLPQLFFPDRMLVQFDCGKLQVCHLVSPPFFSVARRPCTPSSS